MNILREIERYVVLPFRFLLAHGRDCVAQKQKCKVCGQADGLNFKVRDDIWALVVPKRWQNRVVCLRCFDRFAYKKGMDYVPFLTDLCFFGTQTSFELSVRRANNDSDTECRSELDKCARELVGVIDDLCRQINQCGLNEQMWEVYRRAKEVLGDE